MYDPVHTKYVLANVSGSDFRYNSSIIQVVIGENPPLGVHLHTFTRSCPVLQDVCDDEWRENGNKVLRPPIEGSYNDLQMYVHWLYEGEITLEGGVVDKEEFLVLGGDAISAGDSRKAMNGHLLARLYVTADTLLDTTLKAAVIDEILRRLDAADCIFTLTTTKYLWENIGAKDDKIRALLIDYLVDTPRGEDDPFWPAAELHMPKNFFHRSSRRCNNNLRDRPCYALRHLYHRVHSEEASDLDTIKVAPGKEHTHSYGTRKNSRQRSVIPSVQRRLLLIKCLPVYP
jgi:hypothetical protein